MKDTRKEVSVAERRICRTESINTLASQYLKSIRFRKVDK